MFRCVGVFFGGGVDNLKLLRMLDWRIVGLGAGRLCRELLDSAIGFFSFSLLSSIFKAQQNYHMCVCLRNREGSLKQQPPLLSLCLSSLMPSDLPWTVNIYTLVFLILLSDLCL